MKNNRKPIENQLYICNYLTPNAPKIPRTTAPIIPPPLPVEAARATSLTKRLFSAARRLSSKSFSFFNFSDI